MISRAMKRARMSSPSDLFDWLVADISRWTTVGGFFFPIPPIIKLDAALIFGAASIDKMALLHVKWYCECSKCEIMLVKGVKENT